MTNLQEYMSSGIRDLMATAYLGVLSNPREAQFVHRMQKVFARGEKLRRKAQKNEGLNVPPFLIASIATTCNLQCKGCYARNNGIASDQPQKPTLAPQQWHAIFQEAAELGVSFALLAGGEPLTRRDLLEQIADVEDIIFPIFTNGTLIGARYLDFFTQHLNMVPVLSIEGDALSTDSRRGRGVYERAMKSMQMLHERQLFFGTSITVTTENMAAVTSDEFVGQLAELGCKLVIYVEYVPVDTGSEHLALSEEQSVQLDETLARLRSAQQRMLFLSFPGDEKEVDGCIAAGRGFFHIGPDGAAEPCPFSPYSDSNVARIGVRGALKSPFFARLRDARALGWQHTGGCTLFEHRAEVEQLLGASPANENQ